MTRIITHKSVSLVMRNRSMQSDYHKISSTDLTHWMMTAHYSCQCT